MRINNRGELVNFLTKGNSLQELFVGKDIHTSNCISDTVKGCKVEAYSALYYISTVVYAPFYLNSAPLYVSLVNIR